MTAVEKTLIVDLLQQREAVLVRIWDYESRVCRLLGKPFAFPDPPPLPSRLKRLALKDGAAQKTTLRRLKKPRENAYRIRYRLDGQLASTLQVDVELCRELLKTQVPGFSVVSVETVKLRNTMDYEAVAVLYRSSKFQHDPKAPQT
jgi:hypothetical protein